MKTIALSVILAITLLSTNSFAAVGGKNTLNGQPFTTLEELITANSAEIDNNTRLIAENADAIASNTSSIVELQTRADAIDLTLTALEGRIVLNEADITAAKTAIQNNSANITDLTIRISGAINQIKSDIVTLKNSVSSLTDGIATLQDAMRDEIVRLDAAIAENSADINVLSATVTSMTANIGTIQSEILELFGRIATAETTIASHTVSLAEIDGMLFFIKQRVSVLEALEAFHYDERVIVIIGTDADDYASGVLKKMVASLNLTNEDWIYIRGISERGTSEICTSNDDMVTGLNSFANNQSYSTVVVNDNQTLIKGVESNIWSTSSMVDIASLTSFNGVFGVRARNFIVGSNIMHWFSEEDTVTGEIIVNQDSDNDGNGNTLIIKAGDTRLEACGF